ncbi:MAG: protein BatD, partial [Candidatus Competibacteraceae bacterium]|nr:protein BatD [Candidatus Competibacteraceae bacterium]
MTLIGRVLLAMVLLSSAGPAFALEARADFRVSGEGSFWVGQRIVVEIDLLSTGFSFSNQQFDLPDLPGVVLMPPDNATLNLSESIDGETWQGLRYQLSLFVLEPGAIQLPPFTVSFSVAVGYGSEPESFQFTSKPLSIEVKLPPNAEGLAGLVTTSRFELKIDWQPQPTSLKVGDALTLTVQRRAANVPGAAIPPFEHATVDGLTAYPTEPEINDSTARGDLTGERIDKVTYVLQKAGDYQVPGNTLHWFDPKTETLHSQDIAPLEFTVAPNPDAKLSPNQTTALETASRTGFHWAWLIAVTLLLVVVMGGYWYLAPRLRVCWQARQAALADSEAGCFKALLDACQGGDPVTVD